MGECRGDNLQGGHHAALAILERALQQAHLGDAYLTCAHADADLHRDGISRVEVQARVEQLVESEGEQGLGRA